ncbi:unnamed protein product [Clavelina lepadiformis]|uniref:Uncharacterized protein n=1 Tax=Clavelina lepadiformis TaxID=159417 RepID=A0ABP0FTV5_CLALP
MLAIIARPLLASKFTPCMYSIELLRFVNANYQILTTVSYTFWTPSKYTTLTYNSNKLPRYFWLHSYKSQSFFFTDFAAGLRPRYDPSFKSRTNKMKKSKKMKEEKPTISVIPADDLDSGFSSVRHSIIGGLHLSSSSPNLQRSAPTTPNLPHRKNTYDN